MAASRRKPASNCPESEPWCISTPPSAASVPTAAASPPFVRSTLSLTSMGTGASRHAPVSHPETHGAGRLHRARSANRLWGKAGARLLPGSGGTSMKNGKPGNGKKQRKKPEQLRSRAWFDNPANADMTALYLERTMNYGLTLEELQSGKPIIGIAQSGSDLSPCNRHHLDLAKRVREGIREAGGVAFEFPTHPIQETCKRPTANLDRNLAYLSLVEVLYGYFIDGV